MSDIPEFFFDFDAIKGLSYEDGFKALFFQLQGHYNEYINKKPTFVFGADPGESRAAREVAIPPLPMPDVVPVTEKAQPSRRKPQEFKADTETITPKTIAMASVSLERGDSGVVITGKADDGRDVSDILVAGYDNPPYGPVVSGRRGRYNLKKEIE